MFLDFTWIKPKSVNWDRTNTKLLIGLWEQYPILYHPQHRDYRNASKRFEVLESIADHLTCYGMESISAEDVKKRLRILRTQYKIEYIIVDKHKKIKRNPNDVYISKWPYFYLLKFLDVTVNEIFTERKKVSIMK